MPTVTFDRLEDARAARSKFNQYLASSDDGRSTTVRTKRSIPDRIQRRLEEEATQSRRQGKRGTGQADLSEKEKRRLKRSQSNWNWRQHGFESMRVKAALASKGVSGGDWLNYYEPGEGVEGALANLSAGQSKAAQTGAGTARERRMDVGPNMAERGRQSERAAAQRTKSAKEPAILERDQEAIDFLEEEQTFGDDPFDISFSGSDRWGRPEPTGADVDLLEERNQQRSQHARRMDNLRQAPITRDPVKWAENPDQYDFPGIDTLDPQKKHAARSDKARSLDENLRADVADSVKEWASDPGEFDLPGVDLPGEGSFDSVESDLGDLDDIF